MLDAEDFFVNSDDDDPEPDDFPDDGGEESDVGTYDFDFADDREDRDEPEPNEEKPEPASIPDSLKAKLAKRKEQDTQRAEKEDNLCVVCANSRRNSVMLPCRHCAPAAGAPRNSTGARCASCTLSKSLTFSWRSSSEAAFSFQGF
eukprot:TRINITY_DN3355_c0_g1_i1.p2 TRINITY_DN3355_c0_g1~~TRINITY_DN3355_c0_g1_i1.p2  ORF type:complete len:146 (-),score=23.19 TRINITY_DN3355_c0_g1_i1:46-483(-)